MKLIKDFPNYRIHKNGKIESCYKFKTSIPTDTWREVKPILDKITGYYLVTLCHEGVRKNKRVHRLLMETFVPNPENKTQINHIDGNKLNNDLSNLEWCTPKENAEHAMNTGLCDERVLNSMVPVKQYDKQGNFIQEYSSMKEAGLRSGVHWQNISKVCRGLRKTAGNFIWAYS